MSKALLDIRDLHVRVEEKEILHGVDLTVGQDETHVLMGPNGTGKSTLGYAITGNPAYSVTEGSIIFNGEDIIHVTIYFYRHIIRDCGRTTRYGHIS